LGILRFGRNSDFCPATLVTSPLSPWPPPPPPQLSPSLPPKPTYEWSLIPRRVFSTSAKPAGFILVWCTC